MLRLHVPRNGRRQRFRLGRWLRSLRLFQLRGQAGDDAKGVVLSHLQDDVDLDRARQVIEEPHQGQDQGT